MWLVSWSENKQKQFKLWSQKQFNPRLIFKNYRNNRKNPKTKHLAVVLFSPPQRRNPNNPVWGLLSHVHVTPLTFCSQRKKLVICIKERAPIFLSNTKKERRSEGERWKRERCFHLQISFKMDTKYYQRRTYAIYYSLI